MQDDEKPRELVWGKGDKLQGGLATLSNWLQAIRVVHTSLLCRLWPDVHCLPDKDHRSATSTRCVSCNSVCQSENVHCISQVVRHVDQPKRRTLVMVIPAHAEKVATLGHPWFHWPMAKWSRWTTWGWVNSSKWLIQRAFKGRASSLAGLKSIVHSQSSTSWQLRLETFWPWQVAFPDILKFLIVLWCNSFLGNHGLFIWKAGSVMATFAKDLSVGDFLVVSQSSNSSQVSSERNLFVNFWNNTGWKANKHLRCH